MNHFFTDKNQDIGVEEKTSFFRRGVFFALLLIVFAFIIWIILSADREEQVKPSFTLEEKTEIVNKLVENSNSKAYTTEEKYKILEDLLKNSLKMNERKKAEILNSLK